MTASIFKNIKLPQCRNITVEDSQCLKKCEGLYVTGYKKRKFSLDRKQLFEDLVRNYQTYKGLSMYPVFKYAYSHLYAKEYWHCK